MIAIILAGGESKRFGSPKAFATIEGEVFYKKIITTLEKTNLFEKIVVSTNASLKNRFETKYVVEDLPEHKGKGPLAGLSSVMNTYENECYFVIACDTPNVTEKAISRLYQYFVGQVMEEQLDIAGYIHDNKKIPTIAFYSHHVIESIEEILNSDSYRMRDLYQMSRSKWLDVAEVNDDTKWYQNFNFKEDLNRFID